MLTIGHCLETYTRYQQTGAEPAVTTAVVDSRQVVPGSIFFAFVGEKVDGHEFVADAFQKGAVAVVAERPLPGDHLTIDTRSGELPEKLKTPLVLVVDNSLEALQQAAKSWRQRFGARTIGITGSVGKTSTKELLHSVLSRKYRTLKSKGNYNNEIGLPLTLLQMQRHHERVVLEMGMYAQGEIALLCDLAQPHIGVLTMIGPVHLQRLGTMEAIVAAKTELVAALPADGVAILNRDDDLVMSMTDHTAARVFTYGLDDRADLWADHIHSMGLEGVRFILHHAGESLHVQVPLLGRHSVHTALRSAAVGLADGMSWEEIIAGLSRTTAQLRLVAVPGPQGSIIIDDTYNASPDSVLAALNLLKDLDGRRLAVLGDMLELGHMEEQSHRLVGRRAADVADTLITVGQRGRWIGEEARAVGMSVDRVEILDDVETAVAVLRDRIQPNDVILVKASWGMRLDRIVAALGEG